MAVMTDNMKIQFLERVRAFIPPDGVLGVQATVDRFNAEFDTEMSVKTFRTYLGLVYRAFPEYLGRGKVSHTDAFRYFLLDPSNSGNGTSSTTVAPTQPTKPPVDWRARRDERSVTVAVALKHVAPKNKWFSPGSILRKFNKSSGYSPLQRATLQQYCTLVHRLYPDQFLKRKKGREFQYKYAPLPVVGEMTPKLEEPVEPEATSEVTSEEHSPCPSCGGESMSGASFCQWCGTPQGQEYSIELQNSDPTIVIPRRVIHAMGRDGSLCIASNSEIRRYINEHVKFHLDYMTGTDVSSGCRVVFEVEVK